MDRLVVIYEMSDADFPLLTQTITDPRFKLIRAERKEEFEARLNMSFQAPPTPFTKKRRVKRSYNRLATINGGGTLADKVLSLINQHPNKKWSNETLHHEIVDVQGGHYNPSSYSPALSGLLKAKKISKVSQGVYQSLAASPPPG